MKRKLTKIVDVFRAYKAVRLFRKSLKVLDTGGCERAIKIIYNLRAMIGWKAMERIRKIMLSNGSINWGGVAE